MRRGLLSLFLVISIFLSAADFTSAQVNTEKLRRDYSKEGFHTTISTSFSLKTGNSEYIEVLTGLRFDYVVPGNWHAFSVADYEFKEGRNGKINNEGFIHFRLVKKIASIYYGEVFFQKQFDNFKLLEDRQLYGGGARFHLVDAVFGDDSTHSSADIFLGIGAMYETETTKFEGDESEKNLVRSTNYISIQLAFDKRASLSIVSYFQPDFNNLDDYRSLTQVTFGLRVSSLFKWNTMFSYFYDSEPAPTVLKTDFEIKSGFDLMF